MKFLVPNYSCLQNLWLAGYSPQIPVLSVLCPELNLLDVPPSRKKFLGTSLLVCPYTCWLGFKHTTCELQSTSKYLHYLITTDFFIVFQTQWNCLHTFTISDFTYKHYRARGGAVGWGTALQAGRSLFRFPMVSLKFFIDILPAALWLLGWLRL